MIAWADVPAAQRVTVRDAAVRDLTNGITTRRRYLAEAAALVKRDPNNLSYRRALRAAENRIAHLERSLTTARSLSTT